ncbi:MAG: hypothetical protein ACP5N7_03730 [Candidatus Pacearchaeota archaeon]
MSYQRTFLLDLSNDSTKYGLDLVCFLKNTLGQTIQEFSSVIVEVERGVYQITIPTIQDNHRGCLLIYSNVGDSSSTSSSSEEPLTYLAGFAINPEECEYVKALYHSEINLTRDDIDGTDVWTVVFFKNGIPILDTNELGTPGLIVIDETGTLVFNSILSQVGTSYFYRLTKSGAYRIQDGEPFNAVAYALMSDGLNHEFPRIHGRDT